MNYEFEKYEYDVIEEDVVFQNSLDKERHRNRIKARRLKNKQRTKIADYQNRYQHPNYYIKKDRYYATYKKVHIEEHIETRNNYERVEREIYSNGIYIGTITNFRVTKEDVVIPAHTKMQRVSWGYKECGPYVKRNCKSSNRKKEAKRYTNKKIRNNKVKVNETWWDKYNCGVFILDYDDDNKLGREPSNYRKQFDYRDYVY